MQFSLEKQLVLVRWKRTVFSHSFTCMVFVCIYTVCMSKNDHKSQEDMRIPMIPLHHDGMSQKAFESVHPESDSEAQQMPKLSKCRSNGKTFVFLQCHQTPAKHLKYHFELVHCKMNLGSWRVRAFQVFSKASLDEVSDMMEAVRTFASQPHPEQWNETWK